MVVAIGTHSRFIEVAAHENASGRQSQCAQCLADKRRTLLNLHDIKYGKAHQERNSLFRQNSSSFPQPLKEALLFQFLEKTGIDKLLWVKIRHPGIRLGHLIQDGFQGFR
jgi:hypothetical protein